jgi:mono/diheme cytochrome c family protein
MNTIHLNGKMQRNHFGLRREAERHAALEVLSPAEKRCRRCALPPQSIILNTCNRPDGVSFRLPRRRGRITEIVRAPDHFCRDESNMKNGIALSCLLIAIAGLSWLVAGCASSNTLAMQQANYPKAKVDAPGLFTENCATCHGRDGRARTFHGWLVGAQNFTGTRWQTNTSDAEIIRAIQTGPELMPAFQKKLSAAEIEALAAYVRTFKPAP